MTDALALGQLVFFLNVLAERVELSVAGQGINDLIRAIHSL